VEQVFVMPKARTANRPRATDEKVRFRVLLKNKRMCCVCHSPEKPIQLHHIDGDRSRTIESNLAVLCLTHHDQATAGLREGAVGFGVKLIVQEVRTHKAAWEGAVAHEYARRKKVSLLPKRKQLVLLFEFELIKAKNEILAARRRKDVTARLDVLTEYLIEEFVSGIPYRRFLIPALWDIASRATGQERVSLPLAAALSNLHLHLVGPHEVKMRREDKRALMETMDVLDTLGFFGVLLNTNEHLVRETCKGIRELAEIASWYRLKKVIHRAKDVLKRMEGEYRRLSPQEKRRTHSSEKLRLIQQTIAAVARS
jgi:hypothetical protein